MDFGKPLPRKDGRDFLGHYSWERPGQRDRWEKARQEHAKTFAARDGLTSTNYRTVGDADMLIRDGWSRAAAFEGVQREPADEIGCEPVPTPGWLPPRQQGFGPWIEWEFKGHVPRGEGLPQLQYVAYCLKEFS